MKDSSRPNSRRRFLRNAGFLSAGALLAACGIRPRIDDDSADTLPADGKMTYRVNHNTGDSVSLLGYGCMRLPTRSDAGSQPDGNNIDQEAVNSLVDYAMAHGVNYYDTSPAYCRGYSERAMGEALSRHPRGSYFIATKLSNFERSTWPREKSIEMFENSLRYLRTTYIDYMLLHAIGGGGMEALHGRYLDNGMLDFLVEQRRKGVIRNLGFSYHGDIAVFDHLLAMMDRGEVHWDFVQIQLNYLDWDHARETNPSNTDARYLYHELNSRGIPVVIMEPLLGGRLAKVPTPIAAKMKARRPDDSLASWAFRYAGTPEGVLTVLSGMTYLEHLQDNIATYSPLQPISADEDAFLQRSALEILQNNNIPCTACQYCMPCPYGIDIPGTFAHYNRCIDEGSVPRDSGDPDYRRLRRRFLFGYDSSVPALRQADQCISCGDCLSKCPQNIAIPTRLDEIARYVDRLRSHKA